MTLQKKCFISSVSLHGLLVVLLVVGPAFLPAPKSDTLNLPVLNIVDWRNVKLTDQPFYGGGSPNATPPAPVVTPPTPVVTPPSPPVVRPAPVAARPPTPAPTTPPRNMANDTARNPLPDNSKSGIKVDIGKTVKRTTKATPKKAADTSNTDDEADTATASTAHKNFVRTAIGNAATRINSGTAGGVSVDIPGPGDAPYANYGQAIMSIYQNAWNLPGELEDDEATTDTHIVIARDGSVISAIIAKGSGNRSLDQSVDAVLKRIKRVPPFPADARDEERVFKFKFNLKSKRLLG